MMKPTIAIFHSSIFEGAALAGLRRQFAEVGEVTYFPFLVDSPAHLKEHAGEVEILVMNDVALRAEDLADFPNLKMISLLGSGYDMLDLVALREAGVVVQNAPTYGIENVAQHTLSLLFELSNHVGRQHALIGKSGWQAVRPDCISRFSITELRGKTLGFVGYGNVAQRVQEMLGGFQLRSIAYSARSAEDLAAHGVEKVSLQQLFAEADIVSVHARSNAANKQLIGADLLARMKPTSVLINTARGDLIDEAALALALEKNQLAGAALDVLAQEPPAPECSLLQQPNCILTPHIAWNSQAARERIAHESLDNVRAFLNGSMRNVVS